MPPPLSLLLVEDDASDALLLRRALEPEYVVVTMGTLATAVTYLQDATNSPAVVLVDLDLPDARGMEVLRALRAVAPQLPLLVLTGSASHETIASAVREGAQEVLVKGVTADLLKQAILHAVARRQFTSMGAVRASLPPTTTAQEDLVVAGQRHINLKWETTQQMIALLVTAAGVTICSYIIVRGDQGLRAAAFLFLTNLAILVVNTYFQRTNHTKIGGVGFGDTGR